MPATVIVARAEELGAGLVVLGAQPVRASATLIRASAPSSDGDAACPRSGAPGAARSPRQVAFSSRRTFRTRRCRRSRPRSGGARRQTSLTIVHCLELGSLATLAEGPFDAPVIVGEPVVKELRDTAATRLAEALARFGAQGEMVLLEGLAGGGDSRGSGAAPGGIARDWHRGEERAAPTAARQRGRGRCAARPCSVLIVRLHRTGGSFLSRSERAPRTRRPRPANVRQGHASSVWFWGGARIGGSCTCCGRSRRPPRHRRQWPSAQRAGCGAGVAAARRAARGDGRETAVCLARWWWNPRWWWNHCRERGCAVRATSGDGVDSRGRVLHGIDRPAHDRRPPRAQGVRPWLLDGCRPK